MGKRPYRLLKNGMSQRHPGKQDRLQAENDYRVNLKAELEIQYLHEKIDRLFTEVQHGRVEVSHSE